MIRPGEIQQRAYKYGVRDQQIEKDYILSWILYGITAHEKLSNTLAFKGGTLLKKVYFPDYRFSEDLDFTLLDEAISKATIFTWFEEMFKKVREESNIPLSIANDHDRQDGGFNFYIQFTGPLGGSNENKMIKVDISRSEIMAFQPLIKKAIIPYPDLPPYSILCYPLEEAFIEKSRSILQRTAARDLYDLWYLIENEEMDLNDYLSEYNAKCNQKGVDGKNLIGVFEEKVPIFKAHWTKVLKDQIHELPDFDQVVREVRRALKRTDFV